MPNQKTILTILFALAVFLGWAGKSEAADFYVAQNTAGADTGADCFNAHTISWFNAAGNWANPKVAEKIGPGDTVHFCGTLTSTATVQESGSAGNEITLLFESGAKFSKAAWGATTSAAIVASAKNYITIDGNNVGIVENTDNGTGLGSQVQSNGIYISSGSNNTVKNLTIKEIYKRTPRSNTDSNSYGIGINSVNTSSLTVDNNTIYGTYYTLVHTATSGNPSGLSIHNNDLSQMSTGIKIALDGATNYSDINIFNNKIYDTYVWDGDFGGSWFHRDGIHTWGNYSGNSLGSINIYNNEFTGDWGVSSHVTGFIYLTDYTFPAVIYNNLFTPTTGTASNGYIDYHCYNSSGDVKVYNNTFKGPSAGSSGYNAIYLTGAGGGVADIKNNIISTVYIGIYDNSSAGFKISSDYNNIYNVVSVGRRTSSWYESLDSWQSYLGGCSVSNNDCNSITSNPDLNSNYTEKSTSPTKDAGTILSTVFSTDKNGTTRPQGSSWDIGAYEYVSIEIDTIPPVAPIGLIVN